MVIDEAVELAKALSTDDSPAYVNGVLGAILAAELRHPALSSACGGDHPDGLDAPAARRPRTRRQTASPT